MTVTALEIFSHLLDEDIISSIDFEFCRFLHEIEPDVNKKVLIAACLTSVAYRSGDVCIYLTDHAGQPLFQKTPGQAEINAPELSNWLASMEKSGVVGAPGDFKPLILDASGRLYLHRLWHFEQDLARQISTRLNKAAPPVDIPLLNDGLDRLFNFDDEATVNWQKVAAVAAVYHLLTVISGGPGTGKTTTVVRLLTLLLEQGRSRKTMPAIALAAPTGKAAARLEVSIRTVKTSLQTDNEIREAIPAEAVTLHQLLGARRHTSRFRFNEDNPLPYDCVIIDEVSMVDQVLMSRLMNALRPDARLVMLGDKDQLASVEAGSVLGDICGSQNQNHLSETMDRFLQKVNIATPDKNVTSKAQFLTDHVILLKKSYRFGDKSGIGKLAAAINSGKGPRAEQLLKNRQFAKISITDFREYRHFENLLFESVVEQFRAVRASSTPEKILRIYDSFKILAAHRKGPWGVKTINRRMEKRLRAESFISPYEEWYPGRPVIINTNDYTLGLSNGDLGVCWRSRGSHELKIYFNRDEKPVGFMPSRLPDHSTAFALTVHKSQGSEFNDIMVVLPDKQSPLLSRELLYTAVTRARNSVHILGKPKVFRQAVGNKIARNSGLADRLWTEDSITD